jgi:hypothetical protein
MNVVASLFRRYAHVHERARPGPNDTRTETTARGVPRKAGTVVKTRTFVALATDLQSRQRNSLTAATRRPTKLHHEFPTDARRQSLSIATHRTGRRWQLCCQALRATATRARRTRRTGIHDSVTHTPALARGRHIPPSTLDHAAQCRISETLARVAGGSPARACQRPTGGPRSQAVTETTALGAVRRRPGRRRLGQPRIRRRRASRRTTLAARPRVHSAHRRLAWLEQRRGPVPRARDRGMDRPSRHTVPDDDGLSLVRDAAGRDVGGLQARLRVGGFDDVHRVAPDLHRVVLDPTGSRVVLRVLELRAADHPRSAVDDQATRARGPLVDGSHYGGCGPEPVPRSTAVTMRGLL